MRSSGGRGSDIGFYRIEVKGHLRGDWSDWLGGLRITNLPNGNTALSGRIVDQAELHGLINKVFALGLSVISVNQEGEP